MGPFKQVVAVNEQIVAIDKVQKRGPNGAALRHSESGHVRSERRRPRGGFYASKVPDGAAKVEVQYSEAADGR